MADKEKKDNLGVPDDIELDLGDDDSPEPASGAALSPPPVEKSPNPVASSPKEVIEVTCEACGKLLRMPARMKGRKGKCSGCSAAVTVPAGKPTGRPKKAVAKKGPAKKTKVKARCGKCEAVLTVPAAKVGVQVRCPRCKQLTELEKVKVKKEVDSLEVQENEPAPEKEEIEKRTFTAMAELEEMQQDSYIVALLKSIRYPVDAMGALIFFVIGIPLIMVVVELIARSALLWGGGSDTFATPDKQQYFAAAVVALSMAVPVLLLGFFCSFLLAVVRTSAEGRSAIPVIQGMHHRSNLATVLAWAALYGGPGVLAGTQLAAEGEIFSWSPASIGLLLAGALLAPMGLLCSATVSSSAGLDPLRVGKGIRATLVEYAQVLLVAGMAGTGLVALGLWVGGEADIFLGAEEPAWTKGLPLRILSYLFFIFAVVVCARCVGLLLRYYESSLPFDVELHSEFKGGAIPQVVALAGAALVFLPLHTAACDWMEKSGPQVKAAQYLQKLADDTLQVRDDMRRVHHPQSYGELEKIVGKEGLTCPVKPDVYPFYELIPLSPDANKTQMFIWIYEKESVHPDGESVNVLPYAADVRAVSRRKLKKLLGIMERYKKAKEDEKSDIYGEYSAVMLGL